MWGCGPVEDNDDRNDKDGHLIITIMMANIKRWKHRNELWIVCLCMHLALSVDVRPIQRLT